MPSENSKSRPVGAALVVGGGIGGMQAALDLAGAGIKVYVVESKPAIGGVMAQLDKTFPTNDCAMCTMAPRLVEIGRHKDIQILTLSEVESVSGEAGNFTVTVKKQARYIDESRCTGCGACIADCPVTLPSEFDQGLTGRKAIYRPFPQAVPNVFSISRRGTPPCEAACPVHQDGQGYVQLIAEGLANKQIASELGISIKTVEKHRQRLMNKLGIHNVAGLTRHAIATGVVENASSPHTLGPGIEDRNQPAARLNL